MIIVFFFIVISGCGSMMAIENRKQIYDQKIFPATSTDIGMISTSLIGGSIFNESDSLFLKATGYTIVPICFLIDIPISVTTDIFCLPYDIYRVSTDKKPLSLAAQEGSVLEIKELLEIGVDPNQEYNSITPLMVACRNDDLEMIKFLVEHGADVNIGNFKNDTPLMYSSNIEIVTYLVEEGADVNASNTDQVIVLIHFINDNLSINNQMEIIKFLIGKGANINAICCNPFDLEAGDTVLDYAINLGYPKEFITFLIENGAKKSEELSQNLR